MNFDSVVGRTLRRLLLRILMASCRSKSMRFFPTHAYSYLELVCTSNRRMRGKRSIHLAHLLCEKRPVQVHYNLFEVRYKRSQARPLMHKLAARTGWIAISILGNLPDLTSKSWWQFYCVRPRYNRKHLNGRRKL